jgi:hypothetical protein
MAPKYNQNVTKIPKGHRNTKWPQKFQMASKYMYQSSKNDTYKVHQYFPLQRLQKYFQKFGLFGTQMCHLANLPSHMALTLMSSVKRNACQDLPSFKQHSKKANPSTILADLHWKRYNDGK